jgi:hypothetical protein
MNWIKKREKKERKRDTTNSISFQEKNPGFSEIVSLSKSTYFSGCNLFLEKTRIV